MKNLILAVSLSFLITFSAASTAATIVRNNQVTISSIMPLGDGSFAVIADKAPEVSGLQCTSTWHFVRINKAGVTSESSIDRWFAIALAAQYNDRKINIWVDKDDGCFVSRIF